MTDSKNKPVVLCFSGLDPTGGAGIQADIEAISAQHAHVASIITALTIQDTRNVYGFEPVNAELIKKQADAIFNDMSISAIKIGMLGSIEVTEAVHSIIKKHPHIPVIFDPVLAAGGGSELASEDLITVIKNLIIPFSFLLTPNTIEARKLTNENDLNKAADILLSLGTKNILLTGTHAETRHVNHKLFYNKSEIKEFSYSRLNAEYHGSGCTLTASLAALISHQQKIEMATQHALDYCHETLIHANQLGQGQLIPQRNITL